MLNTTFKKALTIIVVASAMGLIPPSAIYAAPTYTVQKVLVAEDQWQGENHLVAPAPLYKPHETDASLLPRYWISSNERGEEEGGEAVPSRAGITIFKNGSNTVLSQLEIEDKCLPVVNPDGNNYGCAPPGASTVATRSSRTRPSRSWITRSPRLVIE